MVTSIYNFLESIGFAHPLHPPMTHIPMGMVIGCFIFGLVAQITRNSGYLKTALHCSVVGIIFIIPTIIAGVFDWIHYYNATSSFYIILKMILATVLTALLAYSIWANLKGGSMKKMLLLYTLCLVCAGGLGYSGGELVYGG